MWQVNDGFRHTRAFALAALLLWQPVWAYKTYAVDSTADLPDDDIGDFICHTESNTCTLRAAVMQASYNSFAVTDGFVIGLPPGFYLLEPISSDGGGELDLTNAPIGTPFIEIEGGDPATTIIDGGDVNRVFHIGSTREAIFEGITIQHGNADIGGGIGNEGSLDLNNVVVDHNVASSYGGGIYSYGILNVTDSSISNNRAAMDGGGIYSRYSPTNGTVVATITRSAIVSNSAYNGAGIDNQMTITIINSTIAANQAVGNGGGIYSHTFSQNSTTNIYNTTIAYNGSDSDRDFVGSGGGIYSQGLAGAAPVNLYNSIIAGNTTSNTPLPDDCYGPISTHARNRFGTTDDCVITEVSGSSALLSGGSLGGLQDNGGPTLTVALRAGSNAIDATDPNAGCRDPYSNSISNDQRGFARNVGLCDIGAYEFGALAHNDLIFRNGFDPIP